MTVNAVAAYTFTEVYMEYNNFNINLDLYDEESQRAKERVHRRRLQREREKRLRRRRRIIAITAAIILALLIFLIVILVKSCGSDNSATNPYKQIQGEWAVDNITKYDFNSDGKGALILPSDTYDFTYEIDNDVITIDFTSDLVIDSSYIYTIKNNVLTISDVNNQDVKYALTKE